MSIDDIIGGFFGGWSEIGPATLLDDLVSQIADVDNLARKRILCEELIRRFVHDVDRACRIAGVTDLEAKRGAIFDQALRGIASARGSEKYFSRDLVKILTVHLGPEPVRKVWRSLYLRQFLYVLGAEASQVEDFLNYQGRAEWSVAREAGTPAQIEERWARAMKRMRTAIPAEFDDEEIRERTDGVWSALKLEEE